MKSKRLSLLISVVVAMSLTRTALATSNNSLLMKNTKISNNFIKSFNQKVSLLDSSSATSGPNAVTVTNNVDSADIVTVVNLNKGDIVTVYNDNKKSKVLGKGTADDSGVAVVKLTEQLVGHSTKNGGSVWVTVKAVDKLESGQVEVPYSPESDTEFDGNAKITVEPNEGQVTPINNVDSADTVTVTDLQKGDIVIIYNNSSKSKILGKGTADELGVAVVKLTEQLPKNLVATDRIIWVTLKTANKLESKPKDIKYDEETITEELDAKNVIIENKVIGNDIITIEGLVKDDIIKVYKNSSDKTEILKFVAKTDGKNEFLVPQGKLPQKGTPVGEELYLTVKRKEQLESTRIKLEVKAELQSTKLDEKSITVVNNVDTSDTVTVQGLKKGDIIKIYDNNSQKLGEATAKEDGELVIKLTKQLPQVQKDSKGTGTVKISLTNDNKLESDKVDVNYDGEVTTIFDESKKVLVTNNTTGNDIITIDGLVKDDIIKVYKNSNDKTEILKFVAKTDGKNEFSVSQGKLPQKGTPVGEELYLTVKRKEQLESTRIKLEVKAELQSTKLDEKSITVVNNVDTSDTVTVQGLKKGDIIKIYDNNSQKLGEATAKEDGELVIKLTKQLPQVQKDSKGTGTVKISLTNDNKLESDKVDVNYDGEVTTIFDESKKVLVTNNTTGNDIITIDELVKDDVIKVYKNSNDKTEILKFVAKTDGKNEFLVPQGKLPTDGGEMFITVKSVNKFESKNKSLIIPKEAKSDKLTIDKISISNNAGIPDIVTVKALKKGDIIKIYDNNSQKLGETTAKEDGELVIKLTKQLPQVQKDSKGTGTVKISLTNDNKLESDKVDVNYDGEVTTIFDKSKILPIVNNTIGNDVVTVVDLEVGDTVKIYSEDGNKLLGSATVKKLGALDINLKQGLLLLGKNEENAHLTPAGKIKVSLTNYGKLESNKEDFEYNGEHSTKAPKATDIIVSNNVGMQDTVTVLGVIKDNIVRVYDASSKELGNAKSSKDFSDLVVKLSKPLKVGDKLYVTLTSLNSRESNKLEIIVDKDEEITTALNVSRIKVINNSIGNDEVVIRDLITKDIVKIYNEGNIVIATATVKKDGELRIPLKQGLLSANGGKIKVSLTNYNKLESKLTENVDYSPENSSSKIQVNDVIVENNVGEPDVVIVKSITKGDTIKVYNEEETLIIGTATAKNSEELIIKLKSKLRVNTKIKVSRTSENCKESEKTSIDVPPQEKTTISAAFEAGISVENNTIGNDTITVNDVAKGDVVKIYDNNNDPNAQKVLSTSKITKNGSAKINLPQGVLLSEGGTINITLTNVKKLESDKIAKKYAAQQKSINVTLENIVVKNNVGTEDVVIVKNLIKGDIVKVYNDTELILLGTAEAKKNMDLEVKLSKQLTDKNIKVSVTNLNCIEGNKVQVLVPDELTTKFPEAFKVVVANNVDGNDTVTVHAVLKGDKITIYNEDKKIVLASVTASKDGTIVIPLPQGKLLKDQSKIHVSLTNTNKKESDQIEVLYLAEKKSKELSKSDITVQNNVGASDTVTVKNVDKGDTIFVYNNNEKYRLLGKATAKKFGDLVVVLSNQLSESVINVSVTKENSRESEKISIDVPAEEKSVQLLDKQVTAINNTLGNDTVTVERVNKGDVIKVYSDATLKNLIGTAKASKDGEVTVAISQGKISSTGGTIYITRTSINKLESEKLDIGVKSETASKELKEKDITIVNNAGAADLVIVKKIGKGDTVKVYDKSGTKLLGSGKASKEGELTIKLAYQLVQDEVNISLTGENCLEGKPITIKVPGEDISKELSSSNIFVTNNTISYDVVTVKEVLKSDIVKVYKNPSTKTEDGNGNVSNPDPNKIELIGMETVKKDGEVVILIPQGKINSSIDDEILVSITNPNKLESIKVAVKVEKEKPSVKLDPKYITAVNNISIPDTVMVKNIIKGDTIKVYADKECKMLIGMATALSDNSLTVSLYRQLRDEEKVVYVTLTNYNCLETAAVEIVVPAVEQTKELAPERVDIRNNTMKYDTVTVKDILKGDIVTVYREDKKTVIVTSSASKDGDLVINVPQGKFKSDGEIGYVTLTSKGKLESEPLKVIVVKENQSREPADGDIEVINYVGIPDVVTIRNICKGDIVKVYDEFQVSILGTATAKEDCDMELKLSRQLPAVGKNFYVSVTSINSIESKKIKMDVPKEEETQPLTENDVFIRNNVIGNDIVSIREKEKGDLITIYNDKEQVISKKTVDKTGDVAILLAQGKLSSNGEEYIKISVKNVGRLESAKLRVKVPAEDITGALSESSVKFINNIEDPDVLVVYYLNKGDTIKIYDKEENSKEIQTAKVTKDGEFEIKLYKQFETNQKLWISVTSFNGKESAKLPIIVKSPEKTEKLYASDIRVVNNRLSHIVKVRGVSEQEIIKIYLKIDDKLEPIAEGKVLKGQKQVIIKVPELDKNGGTIYVTIRKRNKLESDPIDKKYTPEN